MVLQRKTCEIIEKITIIIVLKYNVESQTLGVARLGKIKSTIINDLNLYAAVLTRLITESE